MGHTITSRLTEDAQEIKTPEGLAFEVKLEQQHCSDITKKAEYTNYEALIFAHHKKEINFYRAILIEGTTIQVIGETLEFKHFLKKDGNSGISAIINGASLGFIYNPELDSQPILEQKYQCPSLH